MIRVNYPDIKVDTDKAKDILAKISENPMGGWFNLPKTYDKDEISLSVFSRCGMWFGT